MNWKAISGEFKHALVVTDIDKLKILNVVRRTHIERKKMFYKRIRMSVNDLRKK